MFLKFYLISGLHWNIWSLCDEGTCWVIFYRIRVIHDPIPAAVTVLAFARNIKEYYCARLSTYSGIMWIKYKIMRQMFFGLSVLRHSSFSLICLSLTALLCATHWGLAAQWRNTVNNIILFNMTYQLKYCNNVVSHKILRKVSKTTFLKVSTCLTCKCIIIL